MAQPMMNRSGFLVKARLALMISTFLGLLLVVMVIGATTGEWRYADDLNFPRAYHTASTLHDGRILIVGGRDSDQVLASAELYDPVTGVFTFTGSLNVARSRHAAVVLSDGRVLIVGGYSTAGRSVEIYDPTTATFTVTNDMNVGRYDHTATLLDNGLVLVVGGDGGAGSAELYDPVTELWSYTDAPNTPRRWHTATLLPNGKVLIAGGGYPSPFTAAAELYDPATGTFVATGSMNVARFYHKATLLFDGKVLVTGGTYLHTDARTEVYDPATQVWSYAGAMNVSRFSGHSAVLLPDARVLVAGGARHTPMPPTINQAEIYDPLTGLWQSTASLNTARQDQATALLADGQVLAMGGMQFDDLYSQAYYWSSTEVYSYTMRPLISIMDVQVVEGDTSAVDAVFSVTLSMTSSQPITLAYATVDGSARAPTDYTAIPATILTFSPGNTTQYITVSVQGDVEDEPDEYFYVNLVHPFYPQLVDPQGIAQIIDNDVVGDLVLKKAVLPLEPTAPGTPVTYTLTFSYTGASMATAITLTDYLPISLTNVHVISSGVPMTQLNATPYTWSIPEISPGQSGILTMTGQLSGTLPASLFTNYASITSAIIELTPNDNDAVAYLAVDGTPRVYTLVGPLTTGQIYTFGNGVCGSVYFTSATELPASLTITYTENYPTHNGDGLPRRYDIIAVGGGGYQARLILCYEDGELVIADINPADEAYLHIYRYQGGDVWEFYSEIDPLANTVTAYNVTEFGVWGLGVSDGTGPDNYPTAVSLRKLDARGWLDVSGMLALIVCCGIVISRKLAKISVKLH